MQQTANYVRRKKIVVFLFLNSSRYHCPLWPPMPGTPGGCMKLGISSIFFWDAVVIANLLNGAGIAARLRNFASWTS